MPWYAAHLIEYIKLREGVQKMFPILENIVLIEANNPEEALKEADRIGKEFYSGPDETLRLNDEPADSVFGGVRKVVECQDIWPRGDDDLPPGHGTEVSYSMFEVDIEELNDLIKGKEVTI